MAKLRCLGVEVVKVVRFERDYKVELSGFVNRLNVKNKKGITDNTTVWSPNTHTHTKCIFHFLIWRKWQEEKVLLEKSRFLLSTY